ncbi:hypothetical protein OG455_29925 [Kitasatospora sp. NBC_01287]|uniref:hypothetical protein n=1 Tax=Kitasatospora sp. NBC_01287 TaxID=2903573 RepID=UPI00225834F7|nr:hypothetical protein [Kitasatospora sp. NBC_01287]MCX4749683.1 hypothetical protein [Kitasatospora sp. NBC_01287]
MTKRPTGKKTTGKKTSLKLRRGTQELLERRGMATGSGGAPGTVGPVLHAGPGGGAAAAGYGSYAALTGEAPFSHGGRRGPEERALTGAMPGHSELKGHRHRGAERHSAH